MKSFGEFLKEKREARNLSVNQLAIYSDLSGATISRIENGLRGTPKAPTIKKLAKGLQMPEEELMRQAGYIEEPNDVDLILELKNYSQRISPEEFKEFFESIEMEFKKETEEKHKQKFKTFITYKTGSGKTGNYLIKVPILGHIAAGAPILAEEHISDWTEVPNIWNYEEGELFMLEVKGDSMIGSRIYEGDKVLVKVQQEVENGEIAVVNVNGEDATLKKVKKINGQTWLFASNDKYDPILIEHERARVIGKVIQVMFEPK